MQVAKRHSIKPLRYLYVSYLLVCIVPQVQYLLLRMFNFLTHHIMNTYDFDKAYEEAVRSITELREQAEALKSSLDEVIEACETLEENL